MPPLACATAPSAPPHRPRSCPPSPPRSPNVSATRSRRSANPARKAFSNAPECCEGTLPDVERQEGSLPNSDSGLLGQGGAGELGAAGGRAGCAGDQAEAGGGV